MTLFLFARTEEGEIFAFEAESKEGEGAEGEAVNSDFYELT